MKKSASIFSLSLLLLVGSCSTYYPKYNWEPSLIEREIANEEDSPISYEELMSFKKGNKEAPSDAWENLKYSLGQNQVQVIFEESNNLPKDVSFKIDPTIINEQYTLRIFHSVDANKDLNACVELERFIKGFMESKYISPYTILELSYNAKAGDLEAMNVLAKIRANAVSENGGVNSFMPSQEWVQEVMPENKKEWDEVLVQFDKAQRKENKKRKALEETRKALMDKLDKAPEAEQFRGMVARNDRLGVVKVLRSYLPWEQMSPFEKKFWENHLSIMADPLPLEDRIFIYRGIDDDMIQVAVEDGIELSKDDAIRKQKIFLMSTMMTKNQGTWNRRLRSLTSMYDKFMGQNDAGSSELTSGYRMTTLFYNHSRQPKGSPFLSLTPRYAVATDFGYKRNTMFLLDPRLASFNFASKFESEVEFLLPLVTFPEDLGAVWDSQIHASHEFGTTEKFLHQTTLAKLKKELGNSKGEEAWTKIKKNTDSFFKPVSVKNGALKSGSDFFKQILGMETVKVVKKIEPDTNMPCMDLIQLFW